MKLTFTRYLIVDYESSNFSISQSVYSPSTPPHIIPILSTNSTTTGSSSTTGTKQPQVAVSTGHNSQSIGAGAIAGIVIAIVLVTLTCGALVFYCRPSRRRRKTAADSPFPRHALELDTPYYTEKKDVNVTAVETDYPMTPPDEIDGTAAELKHELDAEPIPRTELESPPLLEAHELPSPGLEPRATELASQGRGQRRLGTLSPDPSPIKSRMSTASSSTPTGWTTSGNPSPEEVGPVSVPSPGAGPTRTGGGTSLRRPTYQRMVTYEAESATLTQLREVHRRSDSSSSGPSVSTPTQRFSHGRFGSEDSADSWEKRMELASPLGSYHGPSRAHATSSPLLPSTSHDEARSTMSSPAGGSVRSGLMSPPPFTTEFEKSGQSSLDVSKSSP